LIAPSLFRSGHRKKGFQLSAIGRQPEDHSTAGPILLANG
jgi:hypothetical protein